MRTRSALVALALAAVLILAPEALAAPAPSPAPAPAPATPPARQLLKQEITPAADRAIERGLAFLAQAQLDDGSVRSSYGRNCAVTSLAGLAFLAGGHTPSRGLYGTHVRKALEFILKNTSPSGFIARDTSHGPMYGHGFGTLFLAQCYGMTYEPDLRDQIRDKLKKAVKLIINTQNENGGWRYQPRRMPADLSVTICQIMALRAARNVGIHIPKKVAEKCVSYVRRSQEPSGGFRYMLDRRGVTFARSAAGVVSLYSAGIYRGKEIELGLNYLMQSVPNPKFPRRSNHYFYGQYYAVQAMYTAGGKYWAKWYPAIRDQLVTTQRDDGSWHDTVSREFGTAMACIILQVPNDYLPIFQK